MASSTKRKVKKYGDGEKMDLKEESQNGDDDDDVLRRLTIKYDVENDIHTDAAHDIVQN